MPEGSCTINVLILAGGFNAQFVSDIQEKAAADTIRKDPTINNIRRTKVPSSFWYLPYVPCTVSWCCLPCHCALLC
jgi:hypothetical protein